MTIVVTGAASGIGRRTAVALARRGHHVVVVTRSEARAECVVEEASATARAGGRVTVVPADLADLRQVRRAVARIAELGEVHGVINNAAILAFRPRRPRLTADGIEEVFAVNHVAPFVLTTGLAPALAPGAAVIVAGSRGLAKVPWLRLDPDDLDSRARWSPVRAYYRSKIAQLTFVAELRRRGTPAVALRVPSVRLDEERLATYPWLLRQAYRPKMRFAADPATVAASYVALATADARPWGHVDERGRPVRWPNGSGEGRVGREVWARTAELAGHGGSVSR